MAFEGALLGTHIVQAILAIPACIKNLRVLLSRKEQENHTALEELENLRSQLGMFGDIASWLDEIKRFHEQLQRFDETLEIFRRERYNAYKSGIFVPQDYRLSEVRKAWEVAKLLNISEVIAFAQNVEKIAPEKLVIGSNKEFISGPEWLKTLFEIRDKVDDCFKKCDTSLESVEYDLSGYLNELTILIRENMFKADELIRKEATNLGNVFSELVGKLQNV